MDRQYKTEIISLLTTADRLRTSVKAMLCGHELECSVCYKNGIEPEQLVMLVECSVSEGDSTDKDTFELVFEVETLITLMKTDIELVLNFAEALATGILEELELPQGKPPLFEPCDTCEETRVVEGKPCPACVPED